MNNVVIRCLCFVQLIPFASNRLHSKPHLADELNRGSYNERQHGILHLPKGAIAGRAEDAGYFHHLREKR